MVKFDMCVLVDCEQKQIDLHANKLEIDPSAQPFATKLGDGDLL